MNVCESLGGRGSMGWAGLIEEFICACVCVCVLGGGEGKRY